MVEEEVVTSDGVRVGTVASMAGFVEVQPLALSTLAGAALLQKAIDAQLLSSGQPRLLIDATRMAIAPKLVNDTMWRWAQDHRLLTKIAVVNQSAVMSVAVGMRAVAQGQRMRGFHVRADAVEWLADARYDAESFRPGALDGPPSSGRGQRRRERG
jgi:hypothetical protein